MKDVYCVRKGRLVPCEVHDIKNGLARISVSEEVTIAVDDLYDQSSLPEFRKNVSEQIQELKKLLSDIDRLIAISHTTKVKPEENVRLVIASERPGTSTEYFGTK